MTDYLGQHFGNYQLVEMLGQGGYAHVYLGEQIFLKTRAAIKVLDTSLEESQVERFRSEAAIIARLNHPNIVRLLDYGIENAVPYLVMEYAPNGTLRQRHPRGMPVPLPIVVRYVQQVAWALDYAHQQRLIHRDIKPENLLLGQQNEVLLSDFGIAVVDYQTTSIITRDGVGTVSYMAPEQLKRKPRPASDQYALAVVVYEWLTGNTPFQGSPIEVAMQHLELPPPSMREPGSPITADVERVVLRAMEKHWQMRYASVREFAQALQAAYSPHPPFVRVPIPEIPFGPPEPDDPPEQEAAVTPALPDMLPAFEEALQEALLAQEIQQSEPPAEEPAPDVSAGKRQTAPTTPSPASSRPRAGTRRLNRRKALLILLALLLIGALSLGGLLLAMGANHAGSGTGTGLTTNQTQGTPQSAVSTPGASPGSSPVSTVKTTPAPGAPAASSTPGATPGATPTAIPPGSPTPTASSPPPAPNLSVSPGSLSFSLQILNCALNDAAKTLTIQNTGGGDLSWSASIQNPSYLSINQSSGSLGPSASTQISVKATCGITVSETDTITITSNGGNAAISVKITLS